MITVKEELPNAQNRGDRGSDEANLPIDQQEEKSGGELEDDESLQTDGSGAQLLRPQGGGDGDRN